MRATAVIKAVFFSFGLFLAEGVLILRHLHLRLFPCFVLHHASEEISEYLLIASAHPAALVRFTLLYLWSHGNRLCCHNYAKDGLINQPAPTAYVSSVTSKPGLCTDAHSRSTKRIVCWENVTSNTLRGELSPSTRYCRGTAPSLPVRW